MKRVVKIGGIQRLPFTKICPEKAANGAFWGYSASVARTDYKGCLWASRQPYPENS
ncbi:hypothetical protein BQ8794_150028 [Mesorhizobium prunaredense]|uniref:Uncharacterized protein n=1 Tax=Mesorhizobium prunaredense TaxID=1631249 RepID=A0A1R3V6F0_9HYPH|nr:hypothetical protein BQ8794_150028 [Mesorhizobium prunaredense]